MDPAAFDRLTRFVSAARSRRSLGGLGLGVLGSLLAVEGTAAAPCPKGRKKCKQKCIAKKKCCTNKNCKPKATGKVCRNGKCACPKGKRLCKQQCIPAANCCTNATCTPPHVCQGGVCCLPTTTALQAALGPGGPAQLRLCPNTTYQGTFTIARNVTVIGAGPASSILDGGGIGPVVTVTADTQVAIAALGITNGESQQGGGILNQGELALGNVIISNCRYTQPNADGGGGIKNEEGQLAMLNCALVNNTSTTVGAGLFNGGSATLTGCVIQGNTATDAGGGIETLGLLTLNTCSLIGNTSADGGALASDFGPTTLTNCRLTGNTATSGSGGAILLGTGPLTLDNCRLTDNTATTGGGGAIFGGIGQLTLQNGTIVGGSTSADANRAAFGGGINTIQVGGTVTLNASHVTGNAATSTDTGTAGGIQLAVGAAEPTFEAGSTVSGNTPCDCNFNNVACANLICPT